MALRHNREGLAVGQRAVVTDNYKGVFRGANGRFGRNRGSAFESIKHGVFSVF